MVVEHVMFFTCCIPFPRLTYDPPQELVKSNNNGYRGSQRLFKDAGGPLMFGPPWDTNGARGEAACCSRPCCVAGCVRGRVGRCGRGSCVSWGRGARVE